MNAAPLITAQNEITNSQYEKNKWIILIWISFWWVWFFLFVFIFCSRNKSTAQMVCLFVCVCARWAQADYIVFICMKFNCFFHNYKLQNGPKVEAICIFIHIKFDGALFFFRSSYTYYVVFFCAHFILLALCRTRVCMRARFFFFLSSFARGYLFLYWLLFWCCRRYCCSAGTKEGHLLLNGFDIYWHEINCCYHYQNSKNERKNFCTIEYTAATTTEQ